MLASDEKGLPHRSLASIKERIQECHKIVDTSAGMVDMTAPKGEPSLRTRAREELLTLLASAIPRGKPGFNVHRCHMIKCAMYVPLSF
jgi:hypothetical protein